MEMIRGCEWLIFPSSGDWEAGDHNSDFNNDKKLSRFTCSMLGKLLFWEKGMSWSNTLQAALLTSWEQVEGITFCTRPFFFFKVTDFVARYLKELPEFLINWYFLAANK